MSRMLPILAVIPVLLLGACSGSGGGDREVLVSLVAGTYKVVSGRGYPASEEARILAITARLDRSRNQLVLTLADGSQRSLLFTPRPLAQWKTDCYTMNSHVREECADLSPRPLEIESLAFATPVAYAKCAPTRMILAEGVNDDSRWLALDLQ